MNTLQIAADSPWLIKAGAVAILFLHIAGGTVGMVAGLIAVAARKGGRVHALAGKAFLGGMLVMGSIGGFVAPFLVTAQGNPKLFDAIGGFLTCYMVATGWLTVRRRGGTIGGAEMVGFAFAGSLSIGAFILAARGGGGAYYALGTLAALAAGLDLKMIRQGGIGGKARLARHLWRMCLALTVALAAFFVGLQRVMPAPVRGLALLYIPPLIPLAVMLFWLLRLRFGRRQPRRQRAIESATIHAAPASATVIAVPAQAM